MTAERSSARERLLETACALFYRDGIRAVGVDTIVEQSGVGKATLYRHFPTKDDLVAAYLAEVANADEQWFRDTIAPYEGSPREQLLAWFAACEQRMQTTGFRGCPFLNAMAEIAQPEHPAYQRAVEHERRVRDSMAQLSRAAGARDPERLADQLLVVLNGALSSAALFGDASPAYQLSDIAALLINAQLPGMESTPASPASSGKTGKTGERG